MTKRQIAGAVAGAFMVAVAGMASAQAGELEVVPSFGVNQTLVENRLDLGDGEFATQTNIVEANASAEEACMARTIASIVEQGDEFIAAKTDISGTMQEVYQVKKADGSRALIAVEAATGDAVLRAVTANDGEAAVAFSKASVGNLPKLDLLSLNSKSDAAATVVGRLVPVLRAQCKM